MSAQREAVEAAPFQVVAVARHRPEAVLFQVAAARRQPKAEQEAVPFQVAAARRQPKAEQEAVPFQVAGAAAERYPVSALGSLASGRRRSSVRRPRARRRWTRPILGR
jgi:hypothetical protein